LEGAVLVIHTKNNGEISEAASGKNKDACLSGCHRHPLDVVVRDFAA